MADVLHDIVLPLDAPARRARRVQRDAARADVVAAPVMGLADGPTEVHKVTVARQVLKQYKPSEGLWPTEHLPDKRAAARKRFADHSSSRREPLTEPVASRTTSTSADRLDRCGRARRAGWTSTVCPGAGAPLELRFDQRRRVERDLRAAPRRASHGAAPCRRRASPRAATRRCCASTGCSPRSRGTDVPHARGHRRVRRRVGDRRVLLRHGATSTAGRRCSSRAAGRRRSTPTSRRARGLAFELVDGDRQLVAASTGGRVGSRASAGPRASTSARSIAGWPISRSSSSARSPGSTPPPTGCAATSRESTSPASSTATTSSPT